jgi:hypothetical protein
MCHFRWAVILFGVDADNDWKLLWLISIRSQENGKQT